MDRLAQGGGGWSVDSELRLDPVSGPVSPDPGSWRSEQPHRDGWGISKVRENYPFTPRSAPAAYLLQHRLGFSCPFNASLDLTCLGVFFYST